MTESSSRSLVTTILLDFVLIKWTIVRSSTWIRSCSLVSQPILILTQVSVLLSMTLRRNLSANFNSPTLISTERLVCPKTLTSWSFHGWMSTLSRNLSLWISVASLSKVWLTEWCNYLRKHVSSNSTEWELTPITIDKLAMVSKPSSLPVWSVVQVLLKMLSWAQKTLRKRFASWLKACTKKSWSNVLRSTNCISKSRKSSS